MTKKTVESKSSNYEEDKKKLDEQKKRKSFIIDAFAEVKKINMLRRQWLYAYVFVDAINKLYSPQEEVKLREFLVALNSLNRIREMQNDDNNVGVF